MEKLKANRVLNNAYNSQSTVIIKGTSLVGSPSVDKIIKIDTSPAGTEFNPNEAIVEIKLIK